MSLDLENDAVIIPPIPDNQESAPPIPPPPPQPDSTIQQPSQNEPNVHQPFFVSNETFDQISKSKNDTPKVIDKIPGFFASPFTFVGTQSF
jgi:hypothetical protein